MPNRTENSGVGCQLRFDGDVLLERIIVFGSDHPPGPTEDIFNRSIEFQNNCSQNGIKGVLEIEELRRDRNFNFVYGISGFHTDLHQLVRKGRLPGLALIDILLQITRVLLAVQANFNRSHGRLRIECVMVRLTEDGKAEIALTDFPPDDPADKEDVRLMGQMKEDLRSLGQIIVAAARIQANDEKLNSRKLTLTDLPEPDDRQAAQRLIDADIAAEEHAAGAGVERQIVVLAGLAVDRAIAGERDIAQRAGACINLQIALKRYRPVKAHVVAGCGDRQQARG